jgi:tetratricopeptide (TPR) repeat protein
MVDAKSIRPAPTANGDLSKTPLVHLLLYALEKKLTGTIELEAADERGAVIVFANGEPAKVRTSEPVAYLGRVMLELGYLTEDQLDRSLAALAKAKASGRKLHGELLLAQGIVNEGQVHAGLREQIARKLRHIAGLPPDTKYGYFDGHDLLTGWGRDPLRGVDPYPILWGMLREFPPWDHVNAALGRLAASPLRVRAGVDGERLGLAAEELAAIELLRSRPQRVSEIARAAQLNERTAQLLAYLLLATRQVDVLAPDASVPTSSGSPPPPHVSPSRPHVSPPPPRVTPPPPRVTPPPLRVTPPPPHASSSRPSRPGASKRPGGNMKVPTPQGISPKMATRWREILERAQTIDRTDYFSMLDVARDATRDEVESAFVELAKTWHPDRLPAELAGAREACTRVFSRMSEARAALVDDAARARYMKLHEEGSGSPEMQETVQKVVDAATTFQKAEVCFKRNDLVQAEHLCLQALELDETQPDYHALLAWLVALKPESQSPAATLDCIKMLDKAISLSNRCEKAYFWRGMLNKRLGKTDAALKDFRRVADMNPRNIDAVREVRLHTMRSSGRRTPTPAPPKRSSPMPQKDGDDKKSSGILGRLFKKD